MLPLSRIKRQPIFWPVSTEPAPWICMVPDSLEVFQIGAVPPPLIVSCPHPPPLLQGIPAWQVPCNPFIPLMSVPTAPEPAVHQFPLANEQWVGGHTSATGFSPSSSADIIPLFPHVYTSRLTPHAGKFWVENKMPNFKILLNAFALDSSWIHPEEPIFFQGLQGLDKPSVRASQVTMAVSRPASASRPLHTFILRPRRIAGRCQSGLKPIGSNESNEFLGAIHAPPAPLLAMDVESSPGISSFRVPPYHKLTLSPIKIPLRASRQPDGQGYCSTTIHLITKVLKLDISYHDEHLFLRLPIKNQGSRHTTDPSSNDQDTYFTNSNFCDEFGRPFIKCCNLWTQAIDESEKVLLTSINQFTSINGLRKHETIIAFSSNLKKRTLLLSFGMFVCISADPFTPGKSVDLTLNVAMFQHIKKYTPHIVCLQESYITGHKMLAFGFHADYSSYSLLNYKDSSTATCSTAFILHSEQKNKSAKEDKKDTGLKVPGDEDGTTKGNKPVASTPVPGSPWCVVWTGDDKVFFFNPTIQLSVWDKPIDLKNRMDINRIIEDPPHKRKLESSSITKKDGPDPEDFNDEHTTKIKRNKTEDSQTSEHAGNDEESKQPPPVKPLDERMRCFKNMLLERGVSAFSTWEKELHKIVFDPRYLLLNSEERKQVFEQFVKVRIKEESKEKRSKLMLAKEEFKKLLEESKLSPRTTFKEFAEKYGRDQRFRVVQKRKDQEHFFNQFINSIKKRDKENRMRLRKMR
ncbi:transcription elongation regulator 1-like protein [Gastrophryne carolinensis]